MKLDDGLPVRELREFFIPGTMVRVTDPSVKRVDIDSAEFAVFVRPVPDDGDRSGFTFIVLQAVQATSGDGLLREHRDARWRAGVIEGYAAYDGIRHVSVGDEGYLFYPSASAWRLIWRALGAAELMHCQLTALHSGKHRM